MILLLLLVGLGLIVIGADWLVEGASAIARKAHISEFVIGLTIVGFGTSCPELVVSLTGAIQGNSDVAVGNIVGSNIFNILFILGITALIYPLSMTPVNRKRDIPITIGVTMLLAVCGLTGARLDRWEAILFMAIFALYLYHSFKTDTGNETEGLPAKHITLAVAIGLVAIGLGGLIYGGNLLVNSATALAKDIGVSDKFIAVTVLAGGTSLPELATSIVAIIKRKDQLALGNILGSNVFNILFILGCSAAVTPLSFASMTTVDLIALIAAPVLLFVWGHVGKKCSIDRWEGAVMLLCFAAYYYYLFIE